MSETSRWIRCMVAAAVIVPGAHGSVHAQCVEHWTTPRVLRSFDGRPAYVEAPAFVRLDRQYAFLGTPALFWAGRATFDGALTGETRADTLAYVEQRRRNFGDAGFFVNDALVASPSSFPVGHRVRQVITARGRPGVTHVAWAESDESGDATRLRSLWYASYSAGKWSAPVLILSADALDWSWQQASILTGPGDDVHVISVARHGDTAGIAHLWLHDGRWTDHLMPLGGLASQVTAQRAGDDSLIVAYAAIGDPAVPEQNGQHIYLIRTSLTQVSWPPARRIQWSGVNAIRWLSMYSRPDGQSTRLTLVWAEVMRERDSAPDTLLAWQSSDRGATWQPALPVVLPDRVSGLAQAQDSEGRVHVVTIAAPSSRKNTQALHRVLQEGRWSTPHAVYTGPIVGITSLDAGLRDTLVFVWGEGRPAAPLDHGLEAPVTLITRLTRRC